MFALSLSFAVANVAHVAPLQNDQLQQRLENVQRDFIVFNRER